MKDFTRAEYERERQVYSSLPERQVVNSIVHRFKTYMASSKGSVPPIGSFSLASCPLGSSSFLLLRFFSDKEIGSISNTKKRRSSFAAVVSTPRKTTEEIRPDVTVVTDQERIKEHQAMLTPGSQEERFDEMMLEVKETEAKGPPRRVNLLSKFVKETDQRSPEISTPQERSASPDTARPSTPETSPTLVRSIRAQSAKRPSRKSFRGLTPSAEVDPLALTVGLRRKIEFLDLDLKIQDEMFDSDAL